MKKYSMTFKTYYGFWKARNFEATCDTDARFIARAIFREEIVHLACGFTLMDFNGKYIEL